jgi:hypothetical protein
MGCEHAPAAEHEGRRAGLKQVDKEQERRVVCTATSKSSSGSRTTAR